MYMYNVLFNFDSPKGLFSGDDDGTGTGIPGPLRASKNWLFLRGNPGNPFDPETANWRDLGEASTLLLHSGAEEGDICVRVAPDGNK